MANVALNKPVLERLWNRGDEVTKSNYKTYDGFKGFCEAGWPLNLTVDLQKETNLETIRFLLWARDARIYKYRLLTSIDSNNWTVHYDCSETGNSGWQEFNFQEKINARFIRIHCLWNSANQAFHIVELQAFDENTEEIEDQISNKKQVMPNQRNSEVGDGLPIASKIKNLVKEFEHIIETSQLIRPEPFQDILKNLRIQAYNIDSLEKSIDSIRQEIITPVKKELEKGQSLGRFSVWGFYVGFFGFLVTIFALLNSIIKWI